jgi:hypothetical protein
MTTGATNPNKTTAYETLKVLAVNKNSHDSTSHRTARR